MMRKNLNVPINVVHTVEGKHYTINGTLLSINESAYTAKVSFKNGALVRDIPIENIYIDEGLLDTIKSAASSIKRGVEKAINYVLNWVHGFLVPSKLKVNQVITAPVNLAISEAKAPSNPKEMVISASPSLSQELSSIGVDIQADENALAHFNEENNNEETNTFWKNMMSTYAKNESISFKQAYMLTEQKYYRDSLKKVYKNNNKLENKLNEDSEVTSGVYDLYMVNGQGNVGPIKNVNTKQLTQTIIDNVKSQIDHANQSMLSDFGAEDEKTPERGKPLLIWGAPGVGKTAILSSANKILNKSLAGQNFYIQVVNTAEISLEDLSIPVDKTKKFESENGDIIEAHELQTLINKNKLPLFELTADPEKNKILNMFYNQVFYRTNITEEQFVDRIMNAKDDEEVDFSDMKLGTKFYTSGILFLDEYSRISARVANIFNNLLTGRIFSGHVLPTQWALIAAANRISELSQETKDAFSWESSFSDRWEMVNFVPEKEEWINWGKEICKATGKQNIDQMILNFLESVPDNIFYETIGGGTLKAKGGTEIPTSLEEVEQFLADNGYDSIRPVTTMRTWTEISGQVRMFEEQINGERAEQDIRNIINNYGKESHYEEDPNGNKVFKFSKASLKNDVKPYVNLSINTEGKEKLYKAIESKNNDNIKKASITIEISSIIDYIKSYVEFFKDKSEELSSEKDKMYLNQNYQILLKTCGNGFFSDERNVIDSLSGVLSLENKGLNELQEAFENVKPQLYEFVEEFKKAFFVYAVAVNTGTNSAQSEKLDEFNTYLNTFNTTNCNSLWQTGQLTPRLNDMDVHTNCKTKNNSAGDNIPEPMKWKQASSYHENIIKQVFSQYGGNMEYDFFNCKFDNVPVFAISTDTLKKYAVQTSIPEVKKWLDEQDAKFAYNDTLDQDPQFAVSSALVSKGLYAKGGQYCGYANMLYGLLFDNPLNTKDGKNPFLIKIFNILSWCAREITQVEGSAFLDNITRIVTSSGSDEDSYLELILNRDMYIYDATAGVLLDPNNDVDNKQIIAAKKTLNNCYLFADNTEDAIRPQFIPTVWQKFVKIITTSDYIKKVNEHNNAIVGTKTAKKKK